LHPVVDGFILIQIIKGEKMEGKNNRNTGIIATIVAVVLCGCPGLFAFCWGSISALVSFVPGADINIGGSSDPTSALLAGLGSLCVGVLFIAVPVAVGYFMLRKKPEAVETSTPTPPSSDDEGTVVS